MAAAASFRGDEMSRTSALRAGGGEGVFVHPPRVGAARKGRLVCAGMPEAVAAEPMSLAGARRRELLVPVPVQTGCQAARRLAAVRPTSCPASRRPE